MDLSWSDGDGQDKVLQFTQPKQHMERREYIRLGHEFSVVVVIYLSFQAENSI